MDEDAQGLGKAYAREFSKNISAKQTPSPPASMRSRQDKRAHQGHEEVKHVSVSERKTHSPGLRDGTQDLGTAHIHKLNKNGVTNQANGSFASVLSKQGKPAAHGGVTVVKHPKQPVAHQGLEEAKQVSLSAGKTFSKGPLDDDAEELGTAFAHALTKNAKPKTDDTAKVQSPQLRGKSATSADKPRETAMQALSKKQVAPMENSNVVVATKGKPQGPTSKPLAIQSQTDPSDNTEHMMERIEEALD